MGRKAREKRERKKKDATVAGEASSRSRKSKEKLFLFRLLAFQPLSVELNHSNPFALKIQNTNCMLSLIPAYEEINERRARGGTYLALEFYLNRDDLVCAAQKGLELVEDFLCAVALTNGAAFGETAPIQIVRVANGDHECQFLYFLDLADRHWQAPISQETLHKVTNMLAHWDCLDTGHRLRRAAHQYRRALNSTSDLSLFQNAYIGLEALEKPLALAVGLSPGAEDIKGQCDNCGVEFVRRRSALVGVRGYVTGAVHPDYAIEVRKKEWKKINELRNEVFHSLDDLKKLEKKSSKIMPVIMHYLHDAICCLSHAHDLESQSYQIPRGLRRPLFYGEFKCEEVGLLEESQPIFQASEFRWVEHDNGGVVPEFHITNPGVVKPYVAAFWLDAPLGHATESDLIKARIEAQD